MGVFDTVKGVLGGGIWSSKARKGAKDLLLGTPEEHAQVSTLRPEQEGGYQDLQAAAQGRESNGAFGTASNYYRNLMSDNSEDYNRFAAPEMRQFNEQIVPDLAEQFAGYGSGGSLSSSGFRNAAVNAGTDLSERLGAIRAQLRQQGAQGLTNIGQLGLGQYSENQMTQPGTQGLAAPLAGAALTAVGGPVLGAIGTAGANYLTNKFTGQQNNQSPVQQQASAQPFQRNPAGGVGVRPMR